MKPEQKQEFKENLASLYLYLRERLDLKKTPKVILVEDIKNSGKLLGKTAHYEPETGIVKLNITDRHPKDILRSFAHEIIHHWQHEHEQLNKGNNDNLGPGYAQKDPHMRKMEKQAYLLGNMIFRDWEDGIKTGNFKKKEKLNEHPEEFADCQFDDNSCCVGPFIIYFENSEVHWLRGNTKAHTVFLDGKINLTKHTWDYETHGGLVDTIAGYKENLERGEFDAENSDMRPTLSYNDSVLGRIFKMDGQLIITFWNKSNQLKKIGLNHILPILKTIANDEGFDLKDVLFNPYTGGGRDKDKTVSYEEFVYGEKNKDDGDNSQQAKDRAIHLKSIEDKKKALYGIGAKPKISPVPDWKKRQLVGVDENLQVSDRNKSKKYLKSLLMKMIKDGILRAYNKMLTSGETIPDNFVEELATKLQVNLEKQLNNVNWLGDKYNQAGIE